MTRLAPSFYPKIWGATSLEPWFAAGGERVGEVWFTHDPPLPLLVKFIFTTARLSVQVHPDKTEAWHVLRAEPDAVVALGFRQTVTRSRARQAALSGEIVDLLEWVPVEEGDTIYVPSGTVHAIGAGVAVCEFQQNSDITYRFFDYGRPRELHLNQALEVANLSPHPGKSAPVAGRCGESLLVDCPYFTAVKLELTCGDHGVRAEAGEVLVVIEGAGELDGRPFSAGETWVASGDGEDLRFRVDRSLRLLRVRQPR